MPSLVGVCPGAGVDHHALSAGAALPEFVALMLYFYLFQQPQMMNNTQDIVDANLQSADAINRKRLEIWQKAGHDGDATPTSELRDTDLGARTENRGPVHSGAGERPDSAGHYHGDRQCPADSNRGGAGPPARKPVLRRTRPGARAMQRDQHAPQRGPGRRFVAGHARLFHRTRRGGAGFSGEPHRARALARLARAPGKNRRKPINCAAIC